MFSVARQGRGERALTVVELLVVIGVVGALIAVAAPFYSRLLERSRSTVCMNHLRSIGLAINLYASDHSDHLPGPSYGIFTLKGGIVDQLAPYLGANHQTFWRCPSHASMDSRYAAYKARYPFFGYHYDPPKESLTPYTRTYIRQTYPVGSRWLLEDIDDWNYAPDPRLGPTNGPVHEGFRNVLFLDARVERVKPTQ